MRPDLRSLRAPGRAHRLLSGSVVVVALALTGCQSANQEAIRAEGLACPEDSECFDPVVPIGPGGTLTVEGFEWGFDIVEGVAVDGEVEVTFINTGGTLHNFRIDGAAGDNKKVEAPAGEEDTGVLQLFAGEYTYYCDVPGHRSQGMQGELVVYGPDEAPEDAGHEDDPNADEPNPDLQDDDVEQAEPQDPEGEQDDVSETEVESSPSPDA